MTSPIFGFIFNENTTDVLTPVLSDFSTVAHRAALRRRQPTVFPLNVPVAVNSGDTPSWRRRHRAALQGHAPHQRAARRPPGLGAGSSIVRVATAYEQTASPRTSPAPSPTSSAIPPPRPASTRCSRRSQLCNIAPRLIGAPGYTGLMTYAVEALPVVNAGRGLHCIPSSPSTRPGPPRPPPSATTASRRRPRRARLPAASAHRGRQRRPGLLDACPTSPSPAAAAPARPPMRC